jgi:hydroxyacylglutathione hydrolase
MSGADFFLLDYLEESFRHYRMGDTQKPTVETDLENTSIFKCLGLDFNVIATPGHSPGGICVYHRDEKILFSGDTLFKRSIGRADLPGSDHGALISSIENGLFVLDEDVKVFPGHGPATSIGFEKKNNPFIL